jgi:hypothetical protein
MLVMRRVKIQISGGRRILFCIIHIFGTHLRSCEDCLSIVMWSGYLRRRHESGGYSKSPAMYFPQGYMMKLSEPQRSLLDEGTRLGVLRRACGDCRVQIGTRDRLRINSHWGSRYYVQRPERWWVTIKEFEGGEHVCRKFYCKIDIYGYVHTVKRSYWEKRYGKSKIVYHG